MVLQMGTACFETFCLAKVEDINTLGLKILRKMLNQYACIDRYTKRYGKIIFP